VFGLQDKKPAHSKNAGLNDQSAEIRVKPAEKLEGCVRYYQAPQHMFTPNAAGRCRAAPETAARRMLRSSREILRK